MQSLTALPASIVIHDVEGTILHTIETLGIVVGPAEELMLPALACVILLSEVGRRRRRQTWRERDRFQLKR